jgi:hypothetical protein
MSFNDLNNLQFYQAPTPPPVTPPSGGSGDSKALDDLSRQLSNPELLKDGAQGALMGLLMYAAELCRQNQIKIRTQEASLSGQLAGAQGQTAGAQADAVKYTAYAAAGGMVASAATSFVTAGASTYKTAKDTKALNDKHTEMKQLDQKINSGAAAQTGTTASDKQDLMARKESLGREYNAMHSGMAQSGQIINQIGHAGESLANAGGQVTSAQGKASEGLLQASQQQQSQIAQNLSSAQQSAAETAKELTNLEMLGGQAAKAAVGR